MKQYLKLSETHDMFPGNTDREIFKTDLYILEHKLEKLQ